MKDLYSRLVGFCLLVTTPAFASSIVINEIMYHPSPGVPEDKRREWIELFNPGTNAVNLSGWHISKGVDFAFPINTVMQPGAYLVVAANRTAFLTQYPGVANVVGDWTGQLSNTGEQIELEDAQGEAVASVTYADSGDWAVRQRVNVPNGQISWDWFAAHDGLGSSLELINPALPIAAGQNWAASAVFDGTPGSPNSTRSSNVAPLILEVSHLPAVPKSTDAVTILARLVNEQTNGVSGTVFYRDATSQNPLAFSSTPMFDDGLHNDGLAGDGLYGATLQPRSNGTIVEFYVQSSDNVTPPRTWPAPGLDGVPVQTANAQYQVDDTAYTGDQPIVRLIMTASERFKLQEISRTNNNSDAQMNVTLVTMDGTSTEIRYSCDIRIRGAGSRSAPIKNHRVNLPSDRPWNGKTALNLNSLYPHAQIVGSVIAQRSGLPAANARIIQMRINGENLARSGPPTSGNGSSWGSYILVEPINNEWAERMFPLDSGGNVYRASSGGHAADLSYQGTNPNNYISRGYSKTSNGSEDDWTDLVNLTEVLNNTPTNSYTAAVQARVNVQEWMNYFAVFSLMEYTETALGSGEGDDYALYRGLVDTRFQVIGHDFDTIFNQGDTSGNINESIWVAADASDQPAVDRFLKAPDFAPIYLETLYRLATTVFTPEQVNPIFDQYLTSFVTEPTITAMKNFNASRRLAVLSQIPQAIRITNSLPIVNGYPTTTVSSNSLTGAANAIRTRSVRVNGLLASWTPWRGTWSITGIPLNPGVNRLLVQSFDAQGAEVDRATIDVVYDDGSVADVAGNISVDTTWNPAGGPYRLNNSVTVAAGAKLTILPGTTVYLGSGASLNVQGQLLAEGTDTQRILFTREPGSSARWGGINVTGATAPETRIAYAHFEFNGSTAIHSTDGTVFLDHLTFGSTDRQYVSLDRSSFVVQNCVFPAITGSFEPVHGTGGIKTGGRGIVTHNFWGKISGYNDAFDFTGGNRPGPILQVINNVFMGSDDDLLDLDSTDAWVEGNIFLHTHRVGSPDSASAVSGGADNADTSQVTIIGNIFYDVDQAANAKQGNFYTLLNNTIVHQTHIGSDDTNTAVVILADENTAQGLGMYLEGNIILDAENLTRNVTTATVTYTNNIIRQLSGAPWTGLGGNNSGDDPLLKRIPQMSETTNFTTWAQAQVMREWFSLQPGSPALGAGPNGRDQGGNIPLGASISGEPNGTTFLTTATLTVGPNRTGNGIPTAGFPNGSGFTHYRWRLDGAGSWSSETPIATPIVLSGLANGPHYVEVAGKRDSDFYQDDAVFGADAVVTRSRTWTVNNSFAAIRLNEVLARNDSAVAHEGAFPDMVELYNAGGTTVDLSGWGLTDEATNRFKFTFPSGTTLGSGQYLLLYGDNRTATSGLHLGFGLDQEADALYLYNGASTLIDSVEFGIQLSDLSIGRGTDGTWTLCTPTLGDANVRHALGDPHALKINEWLANGQTLYPDDFIEIYNPTPAPVLLGGLHLTDEPLGWPGLHRVVPLTFMGAGAHFVFTADSHTADGPDHVDFKLSANQGAIGLFDATTNLIDCIFYGPQRSDISEGRSPSGSSAISKFNVPTPGGPNPGPSGSLTIISNFIVNIFSPVDKQWRYDGSGTDRLTAWRAANYNDSSWALGFGMFGTETPGVYPYPIISSIPSPDLGGPNTAYFRTHFQWTNGLGFSLVATSYVDDGAVFYLNGQEASRVRISANPVLFNSAAQNVTDGSFDVLTLPTTNLVTGDNVIAVEVHQPGGASSDVVFGLSLSAVKSSTNTIVFGLVLNEVMARNQSFTNAGGTNLADWFELYNPSQNTLNLSGMSVSDQIDNPRRWVFPPGTVLSAGAYLIVRCDPDLPATTNAGPVLNTGFGLDGEGGDAVYIFDTVPHGGAILDSVLFGIQVPDLTIGRSPNATGPWTLALPTPGSPNIAAALGNAANLKINEWLANPSGNDDDFIELYNPNSQPVALGGLYLSDSFTNRTASRLQALSFIGTGDDAFVRFLADGDTAAGADHLDFNLRSAGESVALFTAAETLIDGYTFASQDSDVSEGRFPDGSATIVRFRGTATPGRSNLLPIENVAISEVLAHTEPPFEDAIELAAVSRTPIDISGWFLSDQRNDPKRFRIPNGTILRPGGFVTFYEYQFNPDFGGRPPFFSLSGSDGGELFLFSADLAGNLTGYRTSARFGASVRNGSVGRYQTSMGYDFTALAAPTFGASSPTTVEQFRAGPGAANARAEISPVVISEIMYHPPDVISGGSTNDNDLDEYIELLNSAIDPVPLFDLQNPTNTWRLRDAVDFEFPQGVTLQPGEFIVLVGFDPQTNAAALDAFRARYSVSQSLRVFGPWRGKLANDNDNIELYKPDAPLPAGTPNAGFVPYVLADKVRYSDTRPWPTEADRAPGPLGISLHRRDAASGLTYGNDPASWVASTPFIGSASWIPLPFTYPEITSITAPTNIPAGGSVTLRVTAPSVGPTDFQWRFNGALIPGVVASSLVLNNFQSSNAGIYSVVAMTPVGSAFAYTSVDLRAQPTILRQPQDLVASANTPAVFWVVADGTPDLSYQWRTNDVNVPGATGPSLTIPSVQPSDVVAYRVVITNIYGAITSQPATIQIVSPPSIVTQPVGTNVIIGQSAIFSVTTAGTGPLRYQWRFNGANITDATNAILTLNNLQLTQSGNYTVRVTNLIGSVISDAATLTVTLPPSVSIVATDASASEPGANTGVFTLTRLGSTLLAQQVFFTVSGSAVPGSDYMPLASPITIPAGADSVPLVVTALDDALLEGNETVVVTVVAGSGYQVGSPATATVAISDDDNQAPGVTITGPADGLVVNFPTNIAVAAAAVDNDGSVTKVEFFADGTNKIGEDFSLPYSVTWTNPAVGVHAITAVASDNLGSTGASAPVGIIVNGPPTVTLTSPSDGSIITPGNNITLAANAQDLDGFVTLVEFFQGSTLLGSDSNPPFSLVWPGVPEGVYTLRAQATDDRGAVRASSPVTITVGIPAPAFGDMFATRGVVTGFTNTVRGTNTTYTRESGEPRHDNRNGNHSAWISWTAPASGPCAMDTLGSTFDTVLAVYTGTSLSGLAKVVSNDDADIDTTQSRVAFSAVVGTTYQIAVDGYSTNASGTIVFHMSIANPYPVIVTPPQSLTVDQGASAPFTVSVAGPGPFTYQWRFGNANINGATSQNYTRNNAQLANAGLYRVIVSNSSGSVTSAPATLTVRTAPAITLQPQTVFVPLGEPTVLSVRATGWAPLTFQWRRNGADIPGATSSNLVLASVQSTNEGIYSVFIANSLGTTISADASVVSVIPLFAFTNTWRYHAQGVDLGTAWRFPGYDDSAWPTGACLFGFETTPAIYPEPFRTSMSLLDSNLVDVSAYYFRKTFHVANPSDVLALQASTFVDDGAVWYINGREAGRVRISGNPPEDEVGYSTRASNLGTEGVAALLFLPPTNLVSGENLISVQLHQGGLPSSDIVFGMNLNYVPSYRPALLTPELLAGGVRLTLTGTPNRVYVIETSNDLANWSELVTFTDFNGVAQFLDTAADLQVPRFYRGRLVQ